MLLLVSFEMACRAIKDKYTQLLIVRGRQQGSFSLTRSIRFGVMSGAPWRTLGLLHVMGLELINGSVEPLCNRFTGYADDFVRGQ